MSRFWVTQCVLVSGSTMRHQFSGHGSEPNSGVTFRCGRVLDQKTSPVYGTRTRTKRVSRASLRGLGRPIATSANHVVQSGWLDLSAILTCFRAPSDQFTAFPFSGSWLARLIYTGAFGPGSFLVPFSSRGLFCLGSLRSHLVPEGFWA